SKKMSQPTQSACLGYLSFMTRHHVTVFVLTFCCYAFFHASRKAVSTVKDSLIKEWTPPNSSHPHLLPAANWQREPLFSSSKSAKEFTGVLDTAFLLAYSVGLYLSGILGDRYDQRKLMAGGMAGSAVTVFLFGYATELIHLYSVPVYVSLWLANGLLQSVGWPCCVAIIGKWFPERTHGFVFGIWSSCASVGNIIGNSLAALVVDYGYDLCFLLPASLLLGGACLILTSLIPDPIELQKPAVRRVSINEEENNEDESAARSPLLGNVEVTIASPRQRPPPLGVVGALKIEGVVLFALSYACLKLVNYAFFFWLPLYIQEKYGWTNAFSDELSSWYDVGGIIAGIICGLLSDLMWSRSPLLCLFLFLAMPALLAYSWSPEDRIVNAFLMAMAGFFVGGPANIISSATCADLGRRPELRGNAEALGTVTGIIDGTGSMGAALGQAAIPGIQAAYGWGWVFYLFVSMIGLSLLCVLPVLVRDIKRRFFSNNRAAEVQVAE
ncbi:hypothetical protein BOX15_Mlig033880g1, partial [Macrostomum lignano]